MGKDHSGPKAMLVIRKEKIADYVFKKQYPFIHRIYCMRGAVNIFKAVWGTSRECWWTGNGDSDSSDRACGTRAIGIPRACYNV